MLSQSETDKSYTTDRPTMKGDASCTAAAIYLRSLGVRSVKQLLKMRVGPPQSVHNLFRPIEIFTPALK